MTKLVRRMGGNGNVPSANSKIVSVNKRQGFGNMGDQQGTTRIIYDSVLLAATTVNTTIRLFEGAKTRQFPLTNLSENKLQAKESLAMERFSIYITQCATGTTTVTGILPLSYHTGLARIYAGQMSFSIAQDQVIKKMPLTSMFSVFNKDSRFMGYYQIQPLAADPVTSFQYSQDVYKFDNPIIIPPMIEFYCDIQIPPIAPTAGIDYYLTMKIEGLGSLYAPKSTY